MAKIKKSKAAARSIKSLKPLALAIVATVLSLHLIMTVIALYFGDSKLADLTPWFDMDSERNFPTIISSLLFLAAAQWAFRLVASTRFHLQKIGWGLLGCLFSYFALDELFVIHERLAEPTRNLLHIASDSPFFHAWVIPAIIAAIIIGISALIIKGMHRQLTIFSRILIYLFGFILAVVAWEILGTYAYSNQPLYRLVMIPIEETTELSLAVFFWLYFRRTYLKKAPESAQA